MILLGYLAAKSAPPCPPPSPPPSSYLTSNTMSAPRQHWRTKKVQANLDWEEEEAEDILAAEEGET